MFQGCLKDVLKVSQEYLVFKFIELPLPKLPKLRK